MVSNKGSHRVYRTAIVGCGRIGCSFDDDPKRKGIWTHAGAYTACPRTHLVALADVDAKALRLAADRWDVERVYPSLEEMLRAEKLDILSVCTPSNCHASSVLTAVDAGLRAIWCEKPMTVTLREADALIENFNGHVIAVNHIRRWDRPYRLAREWLLAGNAGKLHSVCAWYTGGVSNMGSHLFDTLRLLLGDPEWVWAASGESGEVDPTLSGMVAFNGGVLCHVIGCGHEFLLFEIDLVGATGRLRISENGGRITAWILEESSKYSGYCELGTPTALWEGEDESRMLTAVEDIVQCLDKGGEPNCNGRDGLKAVEMVTAFLRSAETGGRIKIPLEDADRNYSIPVR